MKVFQEGMMKQVMKLLKLHIYTAAVGTLFGMMFLGVVSLKSSMYTAFSVLFTVIYFIVIYIRAWECAIYDKKQYSTTSVYLLKGAVLTIGIIACNFVLWLLYAFSWKYLSIDGMIATTTGTIYNMIYVVYTFMYAGFAKITQGVVSLSAHLLIILVPLVASTLGYIAGAKNISISEKILPFVYEKKKDDSNKELKLKVKTNKKEEPEEVLEEDLEEDEEEI